MRTMAMWVMVAVLAGTAFGADQKRPNLDRRSHKALWAKLNRFLPGGYAFIDRLELREEQKEKLGKIAAEYNARLLKARQEAHKELKHLREDKETRDQYGAKMDEFVKQRVGEPPIEAVALVLDGEQLERLEKAHAAVIEWNRWVEAELPKYQKQLTELLGEAPEKTRQHYTFDQAVGRLEAVLPGARLLPYVALDEEVRKELAKLAWSRARAYLSAERTSAAMLLREREKLPHGSRGDFSRATAVVRRSDMQQDKAERVVKLLPQDLRERLAKADKIARERDMAIRKQLVATWDKINAAVPPRTTPRLASPRSGSPEPDEKALAVIDEWNAWLATELPKMDRQVDELIGPVGAANAQQQLLILRRASAGDALFGELLLRLNLSDKQWQQIAEAVARMEAFNRASTNLDTPATKQYAEVIHGVKNTHVNSAELTEAVLGVLTDAQRKKLEQGQKLLEANAERLVQARDEVIDKLSKLLAKESKGEEAQ
jgi:hypothetical protein